MGMLRYILQIIKIQNSKYKCKFDVKDLHLSGGGARKQGGGASGPPRGVEGEVRQDSP